MPVIVLDLEDIFTETVPLECPASVSLHFVTSSEHQEGSRRSDRVPSLAKAAVPPTSLRTPQGLPSKSGWRKIFGSRGQGIWGASKTLMPAQRLHQEAPTGESNCPRGPFLPLPPLVWSMRSPKQFPHFTCEVDHIPHSPKHRKQNSQAQTIQRPLFVLGIETTLCLGLQGPSSFCRLHGPPELPAWPLLNPQLTCFLLPFPLAAMLFPLPLPCSALLRPLPSGIGPLPEPLRPAPSTRLLQPRLWSDTGRCVCPVPGSPWDSELHGAGTRPAFCSPPLPAHSGAL